MTRVPYASRDNMDADGQRDRDLPRRRGPQLRGDTEQPAGRRGHGRAGRLRPLRDAPAAARQGAGRAHRRREACGQYVWTVNQPGARQAGLSEEIIAAIHEYRAPAGFGADDATVVQFVLELLRQHRVSDATFEALRALVGNTGVVDVLVVSGYYHTLAHTLQALDVDLPEGTENALTY